MNVIQEKQIIVMGDTKRLMIMTKEHTERVVGLFRYPKMNENDDCLVNNCLGKVAYFKYMV